MLENPPAWDNVDVIVLAVQYIFLVSHFSLFLFAHHFKEIIESHLRYSTSYPELPLTKYPDINMCNYTTTLYHHCTHRVFTATICPGAIAYGAPCYAHGDPKPPSSDLVVDGECKQCSGEMCTDGGCEWKLRKAKQGGWGMEAQVVGKMVKVVEDADEVNNGKMQKYDKEDDDFVAPKLTKAARLGTVLGAAEARGAEGSVKGKGRHHHWHLPGRAK
ncbi:MAG: hypothetical protein Q9184_006301 [Pyrenodesmia sp. 2 TL-2023]